MIFYSYFRDDSVTLMIVWDYKNKGTKDNLGRETLLCIQIISSNQETINIVLLELRIHATQKRTVIPGKEITTKFLVGSQPLKQIWRWIQNDENLAPLDFDNWGRSMNYVNVGRLDAVDECFKRLFARWAFQLDTTPIYQALKAKEVAAWGTRFIFMRSQTYGALAVVVISLRRGAVSRRLIVGSHISESVRALCESA